MTQREDMPKRAQATMRMLDELWPVMQALGQEDKWSESYTISLLAKVMYKESNDERK